MRGGGDEEGLESVGKSVSTVMQTHPPAAARDVGGVYGFSVVQGKAVHANDNVPWRFRFLFSKGEA